MYSATVSGPRNRMRLASSRISPSCCSCVCVGLGDRRPSMPDVSIATVRLVHSRRTGAHSRTARPIIARTRVFTRAFVHI
eukprot:scaffold4173_cov117-Isochrysis_galbana.AAC.7